MIALCQPQSLYRPVRRSFKRLGIVPHRPSTLITHKEKTMKRLTKATAFMVPLLLLVGPAPHFAATYEPRPIETMIEKSDLVVIGAVEKTSVYETEQGDARRKTTIRIQEIIKGGDKDVGETIIVDHLEGAPGSKGGEIKHYAYFRPIFTLGEQTLLLLLSRGDIYEVTGDFRGKIDVVGDKVAGTGTNATLSVAPNPSNPSITIRFNIPQPMAVSLAIYDILGQRIHTLISTEYRQAGHYSVVWNGRDMSGQRAASGIYFINLHAGEQLYQEKLTLVR